MIQIFKRRTSQIFGCLTLAAMPSVALAQGNTFNPYGNSGYADYRESAYPMYSNDSSMPGQARINAMPLGERPNRANQLEQYLERAEGSVPTPLDPNARRGVSAPGVPYYQTFRQYDAQYNRVYTPNNTKADRDFSARLKQRDTKYAEALKETDPTKRAQILRQLANDSLDAPRASASAAPKPKSKAAAGTAKSKAAGAERRGTAPPPPRAGAAPRQVSPIGPTPYPRGIDSASGAPAPRPRPPVATTPAPEPVPAPAPAPIVPAVPPPG